MKVKIISLKKEIGLYSVATNSTLTT